MGFSCPNRGRDGSLPPARDMESPTKEIEEFESSSLKYLQPDQIEKIWLRLRGLPVPYPPQRKYKKTSQRLRCLVKQLDRGEASLVDLKKNLEYASTVLESVYIEETRRLVDRRMNSVTSSRTRGGGA
ncbi:hypothetical protein ANANG_G00168850 [Anguilla anguilla]|uniref:Uncharacterized protein n=1 Tax=Anguilla anguilla TaxID=7936 RepID=A0A9D3RTU8_ANGAN|nr:hypothetical protein ANANG_G00168850 [Anguilla anguilla]